MELGHYELRYSKLANDAFTIYDVATDAQTVQPTERSHSAACVSGIFVYIYGGKNGSVYCGDLWRFNTATGQWMNMETEGEHPVFRQEHTLSAYKHKLYIFGGEIGAGADCLLWTLDLKETPLRWRKICQPKPGAEMPCGRRQHTAVLYNKALHVYGGYVDLKGSTAELWSFNLAKETWSLVHNGDSSTSGAGARHGHVAVTHDGHMWVHGGQMHLKALKDLWSWSFGSRCWKKHKVRPCPPEVHDHTACKVSLIVNVAKDKAGNYMVIYGGVSQAVTQNSLWSLDLDKVVWCRLRNDGMIQAPPRSKHAAVLLSFNDAIKTTTNGLTTVMTQTLAQHDNHALKRNSGVMKYSGKVLKSDLVDRPYLQQRLQRHNSSLIEEEETCFQCSDFHKYSQFPLISMLEYKTSYLSSIIEDEEEKMFLRNPTCIKYLKNLVYDSKHAFGGLVNKAYSRQSSASSVTSEDDLFHLFEIESNSNNPGLLRTNSRDLFVEDISDKSFDELNATHIDELNKMTENHKDKSCLLTNCEESVEIHDVCMEGSKVGRKRYELMVLGGLQDLSRAYATEPLSVWYFQLPV